MAIKNIKLNEGDDISISINGATTHSAVFVQFLHGEISQTTEKAIQITTNIANKDYTIWLPKRCLSPEGSYYKLAKWFKPNRYQGWVFENCEVSGISVA